MEKVVVGPVTERVIAFLHKEADTFDEVAERNFYSHHNHDYKMRAIGLREVAKILKNGRRSLIHGTVIETVSLD